MQKHRRDALHHHPTIHLPLTLVLLQFLRLVVFASDYSATPTPLVRIGILTEQRSIDFYIPGEASVEHSGRMVKLARGRWRVKALESIAASFSVHLSFGRFDNAGSAQRLVQSLLRKGLVTEVHETKIQRPLALLYTHDTIYQVLLRKRFSEEVTAAAYRKRISRLSNSETVRIVAGRSHGLQRFTNLDTGERFETEFLLMQTPDIHISNIDVGSGFHWQSIVSRRYRGNFEFSVDWSGGITLVNELDIEDYLKGVLPSEMPAEFPYESLKAQAIAARSEAATKVGFRHVGEPYDICDEVHCQVFSGISERSTETDMAVESTRGIYAIYRDRIVEAFYSGVCGGYTENNENVWNMDGMPYLRGRPDDASKHDNRGSYAPRKIEKWIDGQPDVYCNPHGRDLPDPFDYARKYFRWTVEYTADELESILKEKTGTDVGRLRNIIARKRGISGRLQEIEVIGTNGRLVIKKELAIRQALSRDALFSGCFYVEHVRDARDTTIRFVLRGAGWGHGVGMCQTGAAVMALGGKKFDQILTHYFEGIFLEKLHN